MSKRVKDLEDSIIFHKNLYYQGRAKISDEDYDKLEDELKILSPQSPVLQMIGAKSKGNNKIKHDKKMLSLEKTYDSEKLKSWINNQEVLSMFKYDGSACSLVYNDGLLVKAKTRGDGIEGESIINKILYLSDVPKRIKSIEPIEVRGEIYCTQDNFIKLSNQMDKLGLDRPSSLRNIVAGLLGRKDYSELAQYLSFAAFELLSDKDYSKESLKLAFLGKMNFHLPEYKVCTSWVDIEKQIEKCKKFFEDGDFLIDGLVITYNECNYAKELGETAHHPRHKIAFKFQGESKTTKIINIEWNISRNGRCTPVAIVSPVELSAAMVNRVTLHHYGIVAAFQLKKNDEIEIIRSGEVIPKFLRVVKSSNQPFEVIKQCPSCQSKLIIDEHWLKCVNKNCPQKNEQEILYFIKSVGIEELSEMRLKEMLKMGLVKEISDLFFLSVDDFLKLDKVQDKLANKFFQQIQNSKNIELVSLIQSLGIEGLGETKIQKIIDSGFDTIDKISNLKIDELQKIDGFAEKSANSIIEGLKEKQALIEKLINAGLVVKSAENNKVSEQLKNIKFCITGSLSKPREQIASDIKIHSGIIQDNVNKETNFLVTNDTESSSSKFVKAKKLGTVIINEDQLFKMIKKQR